MMHSMEKMYGNDYKMTNQDYNKFDMMKMANEKNFDSQDYKKYNYAPPQARFRFKRQAPEAPSPTRSQTTPSLLQVLTEVIDSLPNFRSKREKWRLVSEI